MIVKYLRNSFSTSGTLFKDVEFYDILVQCTKLPKNVKKSSQGAIWIYDSDRLGYDGQTSLGIIFMDIDWISKEVAEKIYDNFHLIAQHLNCLLAIQFSSSYYLKPDKKCGLHVFFKSNILNYYEYRDEAQILLGIFSQLVLKLLGIDLLESSINGNDIVLDFHNTKMTQKFDLFYSTFKYNEYCLNFNKDIVQFSDLEKLIEKYDLKLYDNEENQSASFSPHLNGMQYGISNKKIKVDRNLKVGKYSGNNLRWRISIIAHKIFGEDAKKFCDKFFYYENNKSIYSEIKEDFPNYNFLVYKWLIENNFIKKSEDNIINEWISEKHNEIVQYIKKYRHLEISAGTGSGKTTLINELLARDFNSIVIVPFNVTNKLYNKCFEVNSNYSGEIPKNKPIVMVWDQAIKHWESIKHRHFIVDESHTLFFDRNYRDSAIKLLNKFKDEDSYVTFISATPAGEGELLNCHKIKYSKKRDIITCDIKATNSVVWSQYNYIKRALDEHWYDKIVLLDDITAKLVYEKFVVEGYINQIAYIRSETKDTKDFIDLRDKEVLLKPLTICTCVAFNGLNFKNNNERILVVGSILKGQTTSGQIIQQIGRIRNSKVRALYFINPTTNANFRIEEKCQKAQEFNNLYIQGVNDTLLSYDRRFLNNNYVESLKEIESYILEHASLEVIIKELSEVGYIKGTYPKENEKENNEIIRMKLEIKRKESDEFKEDIFSGKFFNEEYEYETNYQKSWAESLNYLISNERFEGIDEDFIKRLFKVGNKHKLVETFINELKNIIRYIQIDDAEFNKIFENKNMWSNMLSSDVYRRDFICNLNKIDKIRKKYKNKIVLKDDSETIILSDILEDIITEEANRQEREKMGGQNGGKNSSPKKQIKDIKTGKIYDSCEACAKDIGKSNAYISKYKDRFIRL